MLNYHSQRCIETTTNMTNSLHNNSNFDNDSTSNSRRRTSHSWRSVNASHTHEERKGLVCDYCVIIAIVVFAMSINSAANFRNNISFKDKKHLKVVEVNKLTKLIEDVDVNANWHASGDARAAAAKRSNRFAPRFHCRRRWRKLAEHKFPPEQQLINLLISTTKPHNSFLLLSSMQQQIHVANN